MMVLVDLIRHRNPDRQGDARRGKECIRHIMLPRFSVPLFFFMLPVFDRFPLNSLRWLRFTRAGNTGDAKTELTVGSTHKTMRLRKRENEQPRKS